MKKYILLLIIPFFFVQSKAQNTTLLESYKDSILHYSSELIYKTNSDNRKQELSDKLSNYILRFAKQENSIDFDLSSLKIVKVITSDDKKLRLFTWVVPFSDKAFVYKGIAQSYNSSKKQYGSSKLIDQTDKLGYSVQNKTLNIKRWYGSYYYKIITTKRGKKTFYTVIGWKGISKTIQSKVIEIITLRNNGGITFGYNLFSIKGYEYFAKNRRSSKRLVFKFSSQSNMYIDYDYQTIIIKTKKGKKNNSSRSSQSGFSAQSGNKKEKVKIKTIKDNMIVLDRLVPTSPQMLEFYDFYYPESNIFDALRWENNVWKYYPDIDARNKEPEEKKNNRKIQYDLIPKQ